MSDRSTVRWEDPPEHEDRDSEGRGFRFRREGRGEPEGIKLHTNGTHYITPGTGDAVLERRGKTWWIVEAVILPNSRDGGDDDE